jgi:hypothetical protein
MQFLNQFVPPIVKETLQKDLTDLSTNWKGPQKGRTALSTNWMTLYFGKVAVLSTNWKGY